MRFFCTTILFIAVFGAATAQNIASDTSAPIVAYWKNGETKTLSITKTVLKTESGKITSEGKNNYQAVLKVVDSTESSYTIEWRYGGAGTIAETNPGAKDFNDLLLNLKVIYRTDETGMFDSVVNYEDIRRFIDQSFEMIFKQARDTANLTAIIEQTKKMFSTRESVEQIVLKDIALYHSVYGAEYTRNKMEAEVELPNVLGGDPWPAVFSSRIGELDPAQDKVKIIMEQQLDKEKAATIINKFISQMAASSGHPIKEGEMPDYIILNDYSEIDVVLSTGWVKKLHMKRFAKTGDLQKTEIYDMVLK